MSPWKSATYKMPGASPSNSARTVVSASWRRKTDAREGKKRGGSICLFGMEPILPVWGVGKPLLRLLVKHKVTQVLVIKRVNGGDSSKVKAAAHPAVLHSSLGSTRVDAGAENTTRLVCRVLIL